MLEAIIAEGGTRSVAAVARDLGIPVATAHRQVHSLVAEGYLARHVRGFHIAGPRLLSLLSRFDDKQIIANAAAPVLHQLAADVGCVVQLGTLETEMVTYRIKTGAGADGLFTRVGMQLEAYCSGIGKVLLAGLPDREREHYLTGGPFPALTPRTIIQPEALRAELARVREQGYAVDDEEAAEGLYCISVPIHAPDGSVPAAISLSKADVQAKEPVLRAGLPMLRIAARAIEAQAFGRQAPPLHEDGRPQHDGA
jgi:DNA-binding IclR family transcriptional regulator